MAVQTLHGLVPGDRSEGLTAAAVPLRADRAEVDALFAQVAETRLRLAKAYDNAQIGEIFAQIYRYEDRIKSLNGRSPGEGPSQVPIASLSFVAAFGVGINGAGTRPGALDGA